MSWNNTYWDILDQIYWAPDYVGMKSIPRDQWTITNDSVTVPRELTHSSGPLYRRVRTVSEQRDFLLAQEEILNQVFSLTFAIAPDRLVTDAIARPLGFHDSGPFETIGRELSSRFGWGDLENVTQHDGLFISAKSAFAVELKLRAKTSLEQIAKYVALLLWEEAHSSRKQNLGLLYIVPENQLIALWRNLGLTGPTIDAGIFSLLEAVRLPERVRNLFTQQKSEVLSVLERMHLAAISWTDLRGRILSLRAQLDLARPGDQTLARLLDGFDAQLCGHKHTGLR